MTDFNFRDLGSRNARQFLARRIQAHIGFFSILYTPDQVGLCKGVLQGCIDVSNEKIDNHRLSVLHAAFVKEVFTAHIIFKAVDNVSTIARSYLLLSAIRECSYRYISARPVLNLINGFTALGSHWESDVERAAQIRAYNAYMRKKRNAQEAAIIAARHQPNVLYPKRQIFLPGE